MIKEGNLTAQKRRNNGSLSPSSAQKDFRRKITSQLFTFFIGKEKSSINSTVPEKHNHYVQGSSGLGIKRNPLGQLSQTSSSKGHKRFSPTPLSPSSSPKASRIKTLQPSEKSKLLHQHSHDENANPNVSASSKSGFVSRATNPVVTTPSQRRLNLFDLTPQSGLTNINSSANPNSNKQSASSDDELDASECQGEDLSDCNDEYIDEDLDFWKGYVNLGPPSKICGKYKARMWNEERNNKSNKNNPPTFSICCKNGQVELSIKRPPLPFLYYLLFGGENTAHFLKNIRTYNSLFQFTSLGGKIDRKINNGGGPYCFKLNGQNYHLIGSLKPKEGQSPKFAQLYVYDTDNEIQNRMDTVPGSDGLDPEIVEGILKMLDENNKLSEGFRYARDRLNIPDTDDFSLILVSSQAASGRKNQVGPSNEVVALIIGDSDDTCPFRDIVVQTKQKFLKRVYETCKHFMSLQYPLLFLYGDDGFHLNIPLKSKKQNVPVEPVNDQHPDETRHITAVIMREYYAYKLMIRPDEGMNLHLGGRLWQQFVFDAFVVVEQYRLDWIRNHQSTIYSDLYRPICDSFTKGDTNPGNIGKNVILPVTHTGSQRYNTNTFFDDCGFPVYRRRRTEASVLKKGVLLDNKKKNKKDTPDESTTKANSTDEIKNFLDGRYICVSEAAWRLLGFDIHHCFPSIERLPVHMEDEKSVSFKPHDDLGDVAERAKIRFTKLEGWFEANKTFPEVADPLKLWEKHWESMSEDILLIRRRITNNNELHLNQSEIQNFSLAKIEKLFNDVGKSLKNYNSMPFTDDSFMHGLDNRLLSDKLFYNKEQEHEEHDKLYRTLIKEQLHAHASIIDSVENGK
ncbi:uncharacterized protein LOC141713835 [Apium graveolens]|uniref:uncharacterized protein LOC141713835 n=1 Tax=Apium graveolens TaxID=4045 RepID=UPI003D78F4B7